MRPLLIALLSLTLAALAVLGLLHWQGEDRPTPLGTARTHAEDETGEASLAAAQGVHSGSRALLEGAEAPVTQPEAPPEDDGTLPGTEAADALAVARLAQVEERFRRRARGIAEALELTDGDEQRLYEVLLEEYRRRAEYFEELRENAFDQEARERVREELASIQVWKTEELQAKLGAELARAVQDFENESDQGSPQDFDRESKERTED